MTWPWVSRAHLEAVERGHVSTERFWEGRAMELTVLLAEERALSKDLLEKYHAVASPAVPESTGHADLAPRVPKVPSLVAQTIKDESGGDPRLAGYMRKRATELRKEKKTEDEIAEQLRTWQTTEDDTAT